MILPDFRALVAYSDNSYNFHQILVKSEGIVLEVNMHVVVFGVGGVGGYFGGRLAQAGENVTFIARGNHLHAMLTNGLVVDSIKGNFTVQPVDATDDTSRVKNVDVIFLCVKAWQIPEATQAIQSMLGPDTFVVPLENGVEAPFQLAERLGKEHVLGGVCLIESHIASPGHIQHTEIDEPYIKFGELDNHPSWRARRLCQSLQNAGVYAQVPSDISLAMWQKLLVVSPISCMGAITRVPVGEWRCQPELRQVFEAIIQECYLVALADGVHVTADCIAHKLDYVDSLPPTLITSLQRDILNGRPSELDAQIGVIVHLGQSLNIPTPIYAYIYYCLLPQERIARGQIH